MPGPGPGAESPRGAPGHASPAPAAAAAADLERLAGFDDHACGSGRHLLAAPVAPPNREPRGGTRHPPGGTFERKGGPPREHGAAEPIRAVWTEDHFVSAARAGRAGAEGARTRPAM